MKNEIMAEYFPWDYADEKAEIENAISSQNETLNQLEKRIEECRSNGNISLALVLDERADAILKGIFNLRLRLQKLQ